MLPRLLLQAGKLLSKRGLPLFPLFRGPPPTARRACSQSLEIRVVLRTSLQAFTTPLPLRMFAGIPYAFRMPSGLDVVFGSARFLCVVHCSGYFLCQGFCVRHAGDNDFFYALFVEGIGCRFANGGKVDVFL